MNEPLPPFLLSPEEHQKAALNKVPYSLSFIDRTLKQMAGLIKTIWLQNINASKTGFLQLINARLKVIFLLCFMPIVSLTIQTSTQVSISIFLFALFAFSRINLLQIYKKIFALSFIFGFVVIAPAALNLVTDGKMLLVLFRFNAEHNFWIYKIPSVIGITYQGSSVVLKFYLKVVNSLTLTLLVIYTTPFNEIIRSLKVFHIPDMFLLILILTHKFIFILSKVTEETYFSLKSRWWKNVKGSHANKLVAGRISFIYRKSWIKYENIYNAMVARGFSGKINLCYPKKLYWYDAIFALLTIIVGVVLILM